MPNAISTLRPSESEQTRLEDGRVDLEDGRADWERPALRRLAASQAQHSKPGQGRDWQGHDS